MPLIKYRVNQALVPNGDGWWFSQPFGDGFQRIPTSGSAKNARELCDAVFLFRSQQGIPLGNYEAEIAAHILKVSPRNLIGNAPYVPYVPDKSAFVPFINRVTGWLIEVSRTQPRLANMDEVLERAAKCAKCRQNVEWKTDCKPCVEAVVYRGNVLRQRTNYLLDPKLKACRLHDLFLPAAVFLDRDNVPKRTPTTPSECWLPKP